VFEGFETTYVDTGAATIFTRHAGDGPPVLLLHGHPRTSATWHRVAPQLVERGLTAVCPDLRGYGRSRGPAPTADHSAHSKRAVAGDMAAVMASLGHERFAVVGHDRGGPVALRLVLDHPDRVSRVAFLDALPIVEHLDRITVKFALDWWHWFFFAQPEVPERVINADPEAWYGAWSPGRQEQMGREAHAEWLEAIRDPDVVQAMLEDYRAGVTLDWRAEAADRDAGRRIGCPVLVEWSLQDDLEEQHGDPVAIWQRWADDVRGHAIDCGHHVAEEAPDELAALLGEFLTEAD
jgi:haloacetate dehalogenase